MNGIKYFFLQFVLFCIIILSGFFLDKYISKPFTYVDLLAIVITFPILMFFLKLSGKLKNRLTSMRSFNKILLSILAIIIATVFTGVLTGEMMF